MIGMKRTVLTCMVAAGSVLAVAQADYPGATWNPADSTNFTVSNRPTTYPFHYVIIHVTEGSYNGAINWFQNPTSNVSAHYVVRSSDGFVTQMVRGKDIAWHAGNGAVNNRSIGIEHEAITTGSNPTSWFTDAMYRSSADLVRWLTTTYGIPRYHDPNVTPSTDLSTITPGILGHKQVRIGGTACPSVYWDWDLYMDLVTRGANYDSDTMPVFMQPGQEVEVIVRFVNTGEFTWLTGTGNNQVTLRTTPASRVSPFFVSGDWISSSNIAAPSSAVPSQGIGEYRFQWRAPVAPGHYTETMQLYHSATGFMGPELEFDVGVGVVDKVIDNVDPGFSTLGGWSTGTSSVDKYGADYRYSSALQRTPASAEWFVDAPQTGQYELYAWWPQGANRSPKVRYELVGRRDTFTTLRDQTTGGGQWNLLGRQSFSAGGGFVRVKALTPQGSVVMADAVRIVGPVR